MRQTGSACRSWLMQSTRGIGAERRKRGAALLDAATLRKVSCIAGAGQRGKPSVKHEDTSEGCIEVRPSVPSGSVDRRADHTTKARKITDDS